MSENPKTAKNDNKVDNNVDIYNLIEKKVAFFNDVIQKTSLHVQQNKILDILGVSEVSICVERLGELSRKIKNISVDNYTTDNTINTLQLINNDLSSILKVYGTDSLDDLLLICFGNNNKIISNDIESSKLELLKKYFHPTSYKVVTKKEEVKYQKTEGDIEDPNLSCSDVSTLYKQFHMKVYGIKLYIRNSTSNKGLYIFGTVDDVLIDFLNNTYINSIHTTANSGLLENGFEKNVFDKFISSFMLKDFLIYGTGQEIYGKYAGCMTQNTTLIKKQVSQTVREFVSDDMYTKRNTLVNLLIHSVSYENQYIAYLLYDILSNDTNGSVDTQEQVILFDSLPWTIKQHFKQAMKKTIQYTNELSNFDINKIPLEQQICLMKTNDSVKEKAMIKLKEVKAKSEDSGSKARHYLDALLKIPFNIYKREPILDKMNMIRQQFTKMSQIYQLNKTFPTIPCKENYSSIEVQKYIKVIKENTQTDTYEEKFIKLVDKMISGDKKQLVINVNKLHRIMKTYKQKCIKVSSLSKEGIILHIQDTLKTYKALSNETSNNIMNDMFIELNNQSSNCIEDKIKIQQDINFIDNNISDITNYMNDVKKTLDNAVHGHDTAKKQIERIIGQWLNGKQDGYCFGFEGPPGVGKCFAKNTPIMLSNGEIKMVQDITINDKLMGDDSRERNILALGNGKEKMYRIEQVKGDEYIVNESHILSLKMTKSGKKGYKHQTILGQRYLKDEIIDICIKDYLSLPKYIKDCLKGYKVGIDLHEQPVELEPYALGCWLGDGNSNNFAITSIDAPIIQYFDDFSKKYNLIMKQGKGNSEITYSLTTGKMGGRSDKNILINILKGYNLINNKHIPTQYKCNSREVRLQLLAGLIDTDGYYSKYNNALEITQKNKKLAEDILWIVRSLGFRGMIKECTKSCTYKGEKKYGQYYRTTITGRGLQDIPTLLERKKPREHKQIKGCLNTGINVIPLEEDEYYGFQIDGNSRFLLGDFTVTHNTSLAKRGLSDCLKDDAGVSRPFAMIQMGGDSNGSSLHGHNYTYVGSTWGSIVQILIDKKCMNPIIFIDEVDKISKTEHGKEIVGILTHLLDPAQNDCFQDKYFSGIDLDLSKALFILSYNDVNAIDKILLDRVHRIKFNSLTLEEKLVICKTHILPEVYEKMGLENMVDMNDEVLKYMIEEYTLESGVRKLKELIFEVVGEINLEILKNNCDEYSLPITVTVDDIKLKYFKDKREVNIRKVPDYSIVGFANGMYATSLGNGGTLPIHAKLFPSEHFLELKLTGLQQEVMRESMHISLTIAWNLTSEERKKEIRKLYDGKNNKYGINIHPGDGSVQKDGPSAGGIITLVIYSLLNDIPIKPQMAMTGEIQMSGDITAIGGLNHKIRSKGRTKCGWNHNTSYI